MAKDERLVIILHNPSGKKIKRKKLIKKLEKLGLELVAMSSELPQETTVAPETEAPNPDTQEVEDNVCK